MNIYQVLEFVQVFLTVSLAILILLQAKGVGIATALNTYYRSRRGFEKFLFILTIVIAILFGLNSLFLSLQ